MKSMTSRLRPLGAVLLVAILVNALFGLSGVPAAYAFDTFTVTKVADTNDGVCDSDCSLREAIATAAAGDTIVFANGLSGGTITLGSTLTLSKDVGIDGSGLATPIAISGNNAVRVFTINSGVTATVNRVTITKGQTASGAAGIQNAGTLTVTNSTFSDNAGSSGSTVVGGIENGGTLTVTSCTFSGNSAPGGFGLGGGIKNWGGKTATVTNSTFSGNSAGGGGGIMNYGTLTVTNSTFSGNSAEYGGGGIRNQAGTATLYNTIVANNSGAGMGDNCYYGGVPVVNGGNNLDSGTSCSWSTTNGSLSNTNPLLGTLTGNPAYFPLQAGSPAINGVTYNSPNGAPATDQRGVARPQGLGYDIGAYEVQPNLYLTTSDALFCTAEATDVLINLDDVAGLYGHQFTVSYDAGLASAAGAWVTSFFDVDNDGSIPPAWNAACSAGTCKFARTELDPDPAVSGSGQLARITLTGVAPGTFSMSIGDDILGDIDGAAMDHAVGAPLPITVCGWATVSGKVTLQGRPGNNVDTGTVKLTEQSPTHFSGPYSGAFSATDGSFSIASVPYMPGGSSYKFEGLHGLYLTNDKTVTITGDLTGQNTRLWAGDANNDGTVSITDLACIGANFGGPAGVCGTTGSSDINADTTTNIRDLVLAGGNFGKSSPRVW